MSDKRFSEHNGRIWDDKEPLSLNEVVDILNKFQEKEVRWIDKVDFFERFIISKGLEEECLNILKEE